MPLPVKLLKLPPTTVMSLRLKSVLGSLSVKLTVAVSPGARLALLLVTAMVGGTVSAGGVVPPVPEPPVPPVPVPPVPPVPVSAGVRLRATVLFGSAPSALKLPAASLNLPLETITAAPLAPAVGVKVAV